MNSSLDNKAIWDFRSKRELLMSSKYEKDGYIIENGNLEYLENLKKFIEDIFVEFLQTRRKSYVSLANAHQVVGNEESNNLRLFIMEKLSKGAEFNKNYYKSAREIIHNLCGNELAIQKRVGLSLNLPNNPRDVLAIHADTWNGVSPYELNIWIPLVDCSKSMCLYILKREQYQQRLLDSKDLLKLTSDELFVELYDDLTWIEINYGQILAFDQSLPHGYCLNKEISSHWSLNCRFKGLHTPYWDKRLGEYFMPITTKTCTRIGMGYEHPEKWI